ncbi:DNA/RNA non-specific endonuclease [Lacticaseibacillus zhaodongensis]|uniref:DNA/RNA non-specific endonuclease n=1 Tax=Lacticaseibacillus zhaodongensis TaxID=2668065 RepID=UPI0012D2CA33
MKTNIVTRLGRRVTKTFALAVTMLAVGAGASTINAQPTNAAAKTGTYAWFAAQNYKGKQTITVSGNKPTFSKNDLSLKRGAWATYGNLDRYNRATAANAMLNKRLMPTKEREPLYINPTGWHNKKIGKTYLFNRSHLIGYQLTGQNNNPKNLITGTAFLNAPAMEHYENTVAGYLRAHSTSYIRYRVEPIFRGKELLARGVHMMGQSVGSNAVRFNVYIFNVQKGATLNYATGNSTVSGVASTPAKKAPVKRAPAKKATVKKAPVRHVTKKAPVKKAAPATNLNRTVYVVKNSKVYHFNRHCVALRRSKHVYTMTLRQAKAQGHTRLCKDEY